MRGAKEVKKTAAILMICLMTLFVTACSDDTANSGLTADISSVDSQETLLSSSSDISSDVASNETSSKTAKTSSKSTPKPDKKTSSSKTSSKNSSEPLKDLPLPTVPIDEVLNNSSNDLPFELGSDLGNTSKFNNVDEFVEVARPLVDKFNKMDEESGVSLDISARENSIVITYKILDDYGENPELEQYLALYFESYFESAENGDAYELLEQSKEYINGLESIIYEFSNIDGKIIYSKEFK